MELKANVKLHNRFDIEVRGLDGELKANRTSREHCIG